MNDMPGYVTTVASTSSPSTSPPLLPPLAPLVPLEAEVEAQGKRTIELEGREESEPADNEEPERLIITGEKSERNSSNVARTVPVPADADADVDADAE